ncbi:MAG TPA: hypothetical protein VG097_20755 [Gemmata sp.]|nr:hypothetical protein [Gemmata sp.]
MIPTYHLPDRLLGYSAKQERYFTRFELFPIWHRRKFGSFISQVSQEPFQTVGIHIHRKQPFTPIYQGAHPRELLCDVLRCAAIGLE